MTNLADYRRQYGPWIPILMFSAAVAAFLWPIYPQGALVAFVGVTSVVFSLLSGMAVNPSYPAIPQFAVALFGVQHVICPMLYYTYPSTADPSFGVTSAFTKTFAYCCWGTALMSSIVWFFTRMPTGPVVRPIELLDRRTYRRILEWSWLTWAAGTIFFMAVRNLPVGTSLGYFFVLLVALRDVAICVLVLLLPRNRVGLFVGCIFLVQLIVSLNTTMFSHFFIVFGAALIFLAHRRMWRWKLILALFAGVLFTAFIQNEKLAYRERMWSDAKIVTLGERLGYWQVRIRENVSVFGAGGLGQFFRPLVIRLNQERIVEQVVRRVPSREPYAGGRTMLTAVQLVIPRVLWPGKPVHSSNEMFVKYTGHVLQSGTSMGVGPLGECYLNFGLWGLIAFAVYCSIIGIISRIWIRLGAAHPLWWAWYLYIMYFLIKAESDFSKAFNALVKSLLFMGVILCVSPVWRHMLTAVRRRPPSRHPAFPQPGPRRP